MNRMLWRWLAVIVPLAGAIYLLYPTFAWYSMSAEERAEKETQRDSFFNKTINLGLDLRGGTHLVLELEVDKLPQSPDANGHHATVSDAIERGIEVIRNRVDQFGVAEPLIARQGEKWIVVQLPGIKDPERAKMLIGKTALLEFRIVDDSSAMESINTALREKGISISSAAAHPENLPHDVRAAFPKDTVLIAGREGRYFLCRSTPELTGAYLTNAKVQLGGQGGYGYPEVSLEFSEEGAKLFAQVTEQNIDRSLAIVLDGVVQSAPTIRTRIPDGRAVIEGSFTPEDAKLLSTVLRAGALPAPVRVIEERTVGPSLGEDSIRSGIASVLFGLAFIVVFMAIYYKMSGVITDLALILNMILLLASMVYLKATLTLPGMAGMILSLAMAVDANVLIMERTREEILAGKTVRMAVDMGYDKAFSAILDSNITTLISALFLFEFGTGPVKGFAVTLTIGIIISMFTAIFATRTYYEWRLQNRNLTSLSI